MMEILRRWGRHRYLSVVITALVLLLFVYALSQQWNAGYFHKLNYPITPILLSALGMFGLTVLLGFLWCRVINLISGKRASIWYLLNVHFISWLARYIPGKISQVVGKVVLGENAGFRRRDLMTSVFYENAFFIGSGISIVLFCLEPRLLKRALSNVLPEQFIVILGLAIIAGLLMLVYFLPAAMRSLLKASGNVDRVISTKSVLLLFIFYHSAHLIAGLGFYVLLMLLMPQNSVPLVAAIGILTAAHIGGSLAFVVPAGLGVRESILILLLTPYMPLDQAVIVSLITRAWSTAADGYVLAAVAIFNLIQKSADA